MNLVKVCEDLRKASDLLALCTAEEKNKALCGVAQAIDADRALILEANARDVERARSMGMKEPLVTRLILTSSGLDDIIASLYVLAEQKDPIGEVVSGWRVPNGLEIRQIRVPLGVSAIIYESRPNVTVDAFSLAYKSSNAVLLRGSSSALQSNKALLASIKKGLVQSKGIAEAVALCEPSTTGEDAHADVDWILNAVGYIDVVLPRGGASLIKRVVQTAKVPVIETGSGVCHLYCDSDADLDMAVNIAVNAKIQKPGVCNAIECALIHASQVGAFMPKLVFAFKEYQAKTGCLGGVNLHCDAKSYEALAYLGNVPSNITKATDSDWGMEFLDYTMAVKVVDSIEEAVLHINTYNTKHSECIVTNNRAHARFFQARVDAACVYVNASTRFTDGGQFGMGAELGISTQKLHARGPMGLTALTTIKYLIDGEGQVRP